MRCESACTLQNLFKLLLVVCLVLYILHLALSQVNCSGPDNVYYFTADNSTCRVGCFNYVTGATQQITTLSHSCLTGGTFVSENSGVFVAVEKNGAEAEILGMDQDSGEILSRQQVPFPPWSMYAFQGGYSMYAVWYNRTCQRHEVVDINRLTNSITTIAVLPPLLADSASKDAQVYEDITGYGFLLRIPHLDHRLYSLFAVSFQQGTVIEFDVSRMPYLSRLGVSQV